MSDATLNTMSHTMKTDKKEVKKTEADESTESDDTEEEEVEDEDSTEDKKDEKDSEDDTSEDESETDSEEEEDSDDSSSKTEELDLDAELEKERKAGEPDPTIADKAFKDREKKRENSDDEDDDAPLTKKDLAAVEARIRKEQQNERALEIAKEMAGSDKEATLIVAKWANRTFPTSLTLREQISEAYVITHSKKLIGERNEAMRALKGKKGVNKNAANAHKDPARSGSEPKISPADASAIRASGFIWNTATRQYEKTLPNGRKLVRDSKTKQVRLLKKS